MFHTTGTCIQCHQVNGLGKEVGPNLSEIGKKLTKQALFESILYPSAGISHNFETWVVGDDGRKRPHRPDHVGDGDEIVMKDAKRSSGRSRSRTSISERSRRRR